MTTEVSKVGQAQTAQQAQPKLTKKAVKRTEIFEGMTVKDVEQNGSEAQKIVAQAFDQREEEYDYKKGDGKFDKDEAKDLNNYRFALDKTNRELRAYNIKSGGTVTIKYNNMKELKDKAHLVDHASDLSGNITFNLRNKTALYENVASASSFSGATIYVPSKGFETCIVRNADVQGIDASYFEGQLNLENVADVGVLLWDSKTEVHLSSKGSIKVDNNSKIDLYRYEY